MPQKHTSNKAESSNLSAQALGDRGDSTRPFFASGKNDTSLAAMFNAAIAQRPQSSSRPPPKRRRLDAGQISSSASPIHNSTTQIATPAASPAPPGILKQERIESSTRRGCDPQPAHATRVKDELTEPKIPPAATSGPCLTTHGSFRVKNLPQPGESRMAWAQAQFTKFKNLAEVPIRLARKPIFLPDGLIVDWTSEVPVVLDEEFIPRIPSPPSNIPPSESRYTPLCEQSASACVVAPPTPQSLPPPPQDRTFSPPSTRQITLSSATSATTPEPRIPHTFSIPCVPSFSDQSASSSAYTSQLTNSALDSVPTLSLFEMHRRKHASTKPSGATSSASSSHVQPTRAASVADSSASTAAMEVNTDTGNVETGGGRPAVDSDDDLYMSHDEYERLSKSGSVEPAWSAAQCAQLERDAVQWLKEFIRDFDNERALLASAYSQTATFSVRSLSHPPSAPTSSHPPLHIGPLDIVSSLLDLPESFAFNLIDANSKLHYDLVVTFDVVVYGKHSEPTPLVMLVCYADPAHSPSEDAWRWVCEMALVLRSKTWDERDRSTEGIRGLVALSHQMTLRKIPANMPWRWNSQPPR